MKTVIAFFMLILSTPNSYAALVCNDNNGSAIAVLGQEGTARASMVVRIDARNQKTFAMKKSSDGVYRALTGFMSSRPELNLNTQTLKMGGLIYDVECSKYRGS